MKGLWVLHFDIFHLKKLCWWWTLKLVNICWIMKQIQSKTEISCQNYEKQLLFGVLSKQSGTNFSVNLFWMFASICFNIQQILANFNVYHQHKFCKWKMSKCKTHRPFILTKRKVFAFADCWSMVWDENLLGAKGPPLWFMPSLKHLPKCLFWVLTTGVLILNSPPRY